MIHNPHPGIALSLDELMQIGDERMAEAEKTIADSQRVARESQQIRERLAEG